MIAWPAPLAGRCCALAKGVCRASASRSRCISVAVPLSIQASAVVAAEAKSATRLAAVSALIRSRMVRCRFRYLRVSGRILMRSSEPIPAPSNDESGRMTVPRCRLQTCARPAALSLVSESSAHRLQRRRHRPQVVAVDLAVGLSRDIRHADNEKRGHPRAHQDQPDACRCRSILGALRGFARFRTTPRGFPLCSSTATSETAGSSEIRLVISAMSTRLPAILTTASLRPHEHRKTFAIEGYAVGGGKRAAWRTVTGGHGAEAAVVDSEIARRDQVADDDDFAESDEHRFRHYRPAQP